MTTSDYLKVAVSAAKQSGKIFKQSFGKPKNVSIKNGNPRDLVTEIDKAIETQIRKNILKHFPFHKIIGEEFGGQELKKNDLVWIIDPVDGTTNYIQGLPFCCISIGLWDKQGPLLGVIYNPVLNQLFSAVRGKGAFLNGKKITVSPKKDLKQAFGAYGWGRGIKQAAKTFPKLVKILYKIRTTGSAALDLCYVAAGIFDFHIQAEINVWDFAAGTIILTEAGGKMTDWRGGKIGFATKNYLASNNNFHQALFDIFKKL